VFPSRVFRHSAVCLRDDSPIRAPADLKGRRVGVGDYQMTAAVWVRGFLQHEYGVLPQDIRWLAGRGVRPIAAPPGVRLEHTKEDLEGLVLPRPRCFLPWAVRYRRAPGRAAMDHRRSGKDARAPGIDEGKLPLEDLFVSNIRPEMQHYLRATGEDHGGSH
jgi:hypothetical protein